MDCNEMAGATYCLQYVVVRGTNIQTTSPADLPYSGNLRSIDVNSSGILWQPKWRQNVRVHVRACCDHCFSSSSSCWATGGVRSAPHTQQKRSSVAARAAILQPTTCCTDQRSGALHFVIRVLSSRLTLPPTTKSEADYLPLDLTS